MKYLCPLLKDEVYPKKSELKLRRCSRGVLLNEKDEVLLIHIKCTDKFGVRDHYELPGGGIDRFETKRFALRREALEEAGCKINKIVSLGIIDIEYNLLNSLNRQYFFGARIAKMVEPQRQKNELKMMDDIIFVPLSKIEEFYASYHVENIGIPIHKRDLCAIRAYRKKL
ncbi:MAG: NUDIX hydrolase [Bacilli bacterium]